MKILAKTKDMSREEWLKWRTKGIGGSDVSVIAGINKFRSIYQLWQEKTGQVELVETENEFTHFGNVLEPIVKKEFMQRTGLKVRAKHMLLQSEEYPFMLADLDGVININGEMCIFEAKTATEYKKEDWEHGVPKEYVLQVQHYMAVTGAKKAFVAALVGGNSFVYHEVLRDDILIAQIVEMEKQFWEENVLAGLEPAADGSDATTEYLNLEYANTDGSTIELPIEALELFDEYDNVVSMLGGLEERKDALCNQMKAYLKESEKGVIAGRTVTWKQVFTNRLDQKRLKAECPEVYENYVTQGSYRRLAVA